MKHHENGSTSHGHDHSHQDDSTKGENDNDILDNPSFEDLISNFEAADRVIWQKPEMVIKLLGNLESKVVADLGAGSGYFSFRLVDRAKKVIAIDVDPHMISWMDSIAVEKLSDYQRQKFETRLADYDNSRLNQCFHVLVFGMKIDAVRRVLLIGAIKIAIGSKPAACHPDLWKRSRCFTPVLVSQGLREVRDICAGKTFFNIPGKSQPR